MDLTPAFFELWREHRDLRYVDHVRDVFAQASPDEEWLAAARREARAREAQATLRLAGVEVGEEESLRTVLDSGITDGVGSVDTGAVLAYRDAHEAGLAAAAQQAAVTPALLDDLHARLCAGTPGGTDATTGAGLAELCDWIATARDPDDVHPVVAAAVAHIELLRLRRWEDGNGRLARLALLLLLSREGYDYLGLLAPSVHWSDPRKLPGQAAEELSPEQAETSPAVEHVVHVVERAVRDMANWVRAEASPGSVQAQWFAFPLQP
jgi:Fic family protein